MTLLILYIILINLIGYVSMGWDKRKARKNEWRIRERTLLLFAALFGSIGSYLGMRTFHHKTKHPKFYIGVPLLFFLQLLITGLVWSLM